MVERMDLDVAAAQQGGGDETVTVDVDALGERERDGHRRVVAEPVPESGGLDPGAGEQRRGADRAGGDDHGVALDGRAVASTTPVARRPSRFTAATVASVMIRRLGGRTAR